ncbi:hypothetical protein VMCG_06899 [Cytospora schulzeri]|uniref:Uncharacterized protein n=1 Tax=Cytospora schulzeri TaxID=448051 RepID=A0A423W227_9PEZI|nr:hypothetical protein VMCG_06899 [Valsa malicola]
MPSFSIFPLDSSARTTKTTTRSASTESPHPSLDLKLPTIDIPSPIDPSPPSHPPPPASPCPWLWKCHSCMTIYRLAVTRRCLECDHQFCLGPPTASSSRGPKARKRKRNRGGPCKAEFDYTSWSLYNSWRRTVLLNSPPSLSENSKSSNRKQKQQNWGDEYAATKAARDNIRADGGRPQEPFNDRRDGLFVRKKHSCWLHCDFPSECHHAIYKAQQEGRPILAVAEALDAVNSAVVAGDEVSDEYNGCPGRNTKKAKSNAGREAQLATVAEENNESDSGLKDEGDKEDVSPCSPEPPRELMYEPEVSPITPIGRDDHQCLSYSTKDVNSELWEDLDLNGHSIKATSLEFEVYADDTNNTTTHPTEQQHHYTDEPDELSEEVYHNNQEDPETRRQHLKLDDLESAYSEKAWFPATNEEQGAGDGKPCKGSERMCRRDRMLALLGRRNAITTITCPIYSTIDHATACRISDNRRQEERQTLKASDDWESWSDSSSSTCSGSSSCNSSNADASGGDSVAVLDLDGDSLMPEALSPINEEDADSMLSPASPVEEGRKEGEPDLITLLMMRNAFMRGDI